MCCTEEWSFRRTDEWALDFGRPGLLEVQVRVLGQKNGFLLERVISLVWEIGRQYGSDEAYLVGRVTLLVRLSS